MLAFDVLEGGRYESCRLVCDSFLVVESPVDYIRGIPPAIAIEQKVNTRNPRSTVGTSTEIYDYLRLLYARVGKTISPVSGKEVKRHYVSDIIRKMLEYREGTRMLVLSPIVLRNNRDLREQLDILMKEGFTRVNVGEEFYRIDELLTQKNLPPAEEVMLVIDRLSCSSDKATINRLSDSLETAFLEGEGECVVRFWGEKGVESYTFSNRFEADGIKFEEPTELMFTNSPLALFPMQGSGMHMESMKIG